MNILYIAHRIPYPPNKGDKIRSFHQIRYLAREHTVHLACLVDERADLKHVSTLERYCASVDLVYRRKAATRSLAALALFTATPLSVRSFYSTRLQKRIDHRLASEKIDRIVVFSSAMAEYVRHVSDIPKVMDFVDLDSEKWQLYAEYRPFPTSWLYRLEAGRLARYEAEVAGAFDHSIFVSEQEAGLFRRCVTDRPIAVIPNGVDLDYFHPNRVSPSHLNQPVIVFTGSMDYFPNVDAVRHFCGKILPLIREGMPETRFYIVGRNPPRQVRALGQQQNVIVTGAVSDIRPYLGKATAAVAPLRIARGVQNKVLEALAMGVPVVGTSNAFQGIPATRTDGIRTANAPEEFAQEVLTLLTDPELRHQGALQARRYVQCHHKWQDHGIRLESLLHALLNTPKPHAASC